MRGSVAHRAIQTSMDFGLTDWSRANRRKRIDLLVNGLDGTPSPRVQRAGTH